MGGLDRGHKTASRLEATQYDCLPFKSVDQSGVGLTGAGRYVMWRLESSSLCNPSIQATKEQFNRLRYKCAGGLLLSFGMAKIFWQGMGGLSKDDKRISLDSPGIRVKCCKGSSKVLVHPQEYGRNSYIPDERQPLRREKEGSLER
ncbi:hypothetical protein J6590_050645 [Homalodisca vitripennis]|nr:hypothetical protein J6590_050645 [Homalodisca vitripennis]